MLYRLQRAGGEWDGKPPRKVSSRSPDHSAGVSQDCSTVRLVLPSRSLQQIQAPSLHNSCIPSPDWFRWVIWAVEENKHEKDIGIRQTRSVQLEEGAGTLTRAAVAVLTSPARIRQQIQPYRHSGTSANRNTPTLRGCTNLQTHVHTRDSLGIRDKRTLVLTGRKVGTQALEHECTGTYPDATGNFSPADTGTASSVGEHWAQQVSVNWPRGLGESAETWKYQVWGF